LLAQRDRALAEAYAKRREDQIAERRDERQRRLRELQEKAANARRPVSHQLAAEQDPEVSNLLAQRPSLKKRLRKPLQDVFSSPLPDAAFITPPLSPRKPAVPKSPLGRKVIARPPEEVQSAQQSQMPRKEHLRATQHQLLKSCGVVVYKQQMKAHFRRILEAVEVGYGASAGHQKKILSNLARPISMETRHGRRAQ